MKRALITGVTGQDGAYLARLLLDNGYEVFGTSRHPSPERTARLRTLGVASKVSLMTLDLADASSLDAAVASVQPDEVYHLAAQSSIAASFANPVITADTDAMGVVRLLETLRRLRPKARVFQASSADMYGDPDRAPQDEATPFRPCTPYAVAKLFGHWMTATYRQSHGMFACCGILFNHESPLRGSQFATRKIAAAVARIKRGLSDTLALGNLDAERDWGFAGDYAQAMWLMLQQDEPDDYVIATGEAHTVAEFVELAFQRVGLSWRSYVRHDPELIRSAESQHLVGNAGKAHRKLGWIPHVRFADLVAMMVDAELAALDQGPAPAPPA
jgi:GDPmannose 4,6-dehydratase